MVDEEKSDNPKSKSPSFASLTTVFLPYSDGSHYVTCIPYGGLFGFWGYKLPESQIEKLNLFLQTPPTISKQLKLGAIGGLPLIIFVIVALALTSLFPSHRILIADYAQSFVAIGLIPYLMVFIFLSNGNEIKKYISSELEAERPVHQPPYEAIRFLIASRTLEIRTLIGAGIGGGISLVFLYFVYQSGLSFIELYTDQNSYPFPTKEIVVFLAGIVMGFCLSLFLAFWVLAVWFGDVWLCHRRFRLLHGRPLAKPDFLQLDPQTGKAQRPSKPPSSP